MNIALTKKDPPFVLAILIVVFGWLTTQIVERTISRPIIEVRTTILKSIPKEIIKCNEISFKDKDIKAESFILTNLSKDKLFKNLSFLITVDNGEIHGVRLNVIKPASSGETNETCGKEFALLQDLKFHPGWSYQINIIADESSILALRLKSASSAVDLKEANIVTWLVSNEGLVLTSLLIIIGLTILIYFIFMFNKQKPTR